MQDEDLLRRLNEVESRLLHMEALLGIRSRQIPAHLKTVEPSRPIADQPHHAPPPIPPMSARRQHAIQPAGEGHS